MKKQFTFIESMIKVGVIGFGGGNALIPVLEQEEQASWRLPSKKKPKQTCSANRQYSAEAYAN